MMGKVYPAKKIYSRSESLYRHFVWMKREFEFLVKEQCDFREQLFQVILAFVYDDEVIGVTDVISHFQCSFDKVVKCVHVDID